MNEGTMLVGDLYVVTGGVRQGLYSDVIPAPTRSEIRRQATFPLPPQAVISPQLDILCPVVG